MHTHHTHARAHARTTCTRTRGHAHTHAPLTHTHTTLSLSLSLSLSHTHTHTHTTPHHTHTPCGQQTNRNAPRAVALLDYTTASVLSLYNTSYVTQWDSTHPNGLGERRAWEKVVAPERDGNFGPNRVDKTRLSGLLGQLHRLLSSVHNGAKSRQFKFGKGNKAGFFSSFSSPPSLPPPPPPSPPVPTFSLFLSDMGFFCMYFSGGVNCVKDLRNGKCKKTGVCMERERERELYYTRIKL